MSESWRVMREGSVDASWWIACEGGWTSAWSARVTDEMRDTLRRNYTASETHFSNTKQQYKMFSSGKYTHRLSTRSFHHVTSSLNILPSLN